MKLGSLFDGSGGFPLAGAMCGFEPVWAAEVEPYPIAVTTSRFPNMKHLGDVSKVNGAKIEPVDIITFGSPCQDMSVAGKRAGIKHDDHGDEETTRSGLFCEAIRIIKEMRDGTEGRFPTFVIWENVPGAFSSNRGNDFHTVLEELIKIVEPSAVMPNVPKGGWAYADCYRGDGWSLAYRIFDSQHIRTAQRRKRIYLVLDLGGQGALQILALRNGLRRNTPQSGEKRQETPSHAQGCVGADDREGAGFDGYNGCLTGDTESTLGVNCGVSTERNGVIKRRAGGLDAVTDSHILDDQGGSSINVRTDGKTPTLRAETHGNLPCVMQEGHNQMAVVQPAYAVENHPADSRVKIDESGTVQTLTSRMGTNGTAPGFQNAVAYTLNTTEVHGVVYEQPISIDRAFFNQGKNALYEPQTYEDGTNPTIVAKGPSAVCYGVGNGQVNQGITEERVAALNCMHDQQAVAVFVPPRYIVRRLTPTECARLQGFPDRWGDINHKDTMTDEDFRFWLEVRQTFDRINGRAVKDYTPTQVLTWYNKLHTDSAEYKMWGNGIALPCALYIMEGIEEITREL